MRNLSVVITDERQKFVYRFLSNLGYNCSVYNESDDYSAIVLPLPSIKNGKINGTSIDFNHINDKAFIFGGCLPNEVKKKSNVYDYYKQDDLTKLNAQATAQGILREILNDTKKISYDNKVLVTGYGNVGKSVVSLLKKCGFNVSVAVRNKSKVCDVTETFYFKELEHRKNAFDYIINTVPSLVINKNILSETSRDCIILEIASKPYGIDFDEAEKLGIKTKILSSIPSVSTPVSSGKFIALTIDKIIKEENI